MEKTVWRKTFQKNVYSRNCPLGCLIQENKWERKCSYRSDWLIRMFFVNMSFRIHFFISTSLNLNQFLFSNTDSIFWKFSFEKVYLFYNFPMNFKNWQLLNPNFSIFHSYTFLVSFSCSYAILIGAYPLKTTTFFENYSPLIFEDSVSPHFCELGGSNYIWRVSITKWTAPANAVRIQDTYVFFQLALIPISTYLLVHSII